MRWWYVVSALVLMPAAGLAQSDNEKMAEEIASACQAQKDGTQFSGAFSSQSDFARVLLCAGYKYRLTTDAGGIRFSLTPYSPGVQRPEIMDLVSGGGGPDGMGIVKDIMATASGIFVIQPTEVAMGAEVNATLTRTGVWEGFKKQRDKDKKPYDR